MAPALITPHGDGSVLARPGAGTALLVPAGWHVVPWVLRDMHHFYNVLKRNFCLSLHFPPNCFCFPQGAAAQLWLVWCQALPLDTCGTGSALPAGTPRSLLKK